MTKLLISVHAFPTPGVINFSCCNALSTAHCSCGQSSQQLLAILLERCEDFSSSLQFFPKCGVRNVFISASAGVQHISKFLKISVVVAFACVITCVISYFCSHSTLDKG